MPSLPDSNLDFLDFHQKILDENQKTRITTSMSIQTDGKSLIQHWTWAAEKGLMKQATAKALKAACTKVLGILDDGDNVDIMNLDVEDTISRFNNLCARDFTPGSLDTYGSRFRKSVDLFKKYVENPAGWKVPSRAPRKPKNNEAQPKDIAPNINQQINSQPPPSEGASEQVYTQPISGELITYPFPIRKGVTASMSLPEDLTGSDVKRITAFLNALTTDFEES